MKNVFTRIARFFWSWGFLKFVLAVIALIILFYVEEDWRGAHEWAVTKAKWEAKGESFDYNKFIPPPVPDEQNLAALPLFRLQPFTDSNGTTTMQAVSLRHALRDDLPNVKPPALGNWQKGELPDMAKIRDEVASNYSQAFKGAKPSVDTLAQFNLIYPFFTDFMADATTRPNYRINEDYTIMPPFGRPLGPLTDGITLGKVLTLHAVLALDAHRPELALQDIETNFKFAAGSGHDPTLVGGLVAMGLIAIGQEAVYPGLAEHAWSDQQLVELDRTLKSIDFLSGFQFAMRGELVQSTVSFDVFQRYAQRSYAHDLSHVWVNPSRLFSWPSGWWDENKCGVAEFRLRALATVDPKARLVFPKEAERLQDEAGQAVSSWEGNVPWRILATLSNEPIGNATIRFAEGQVWLDEVRMACALERYRLARGVYPGTLAELAPTYIDAVPHDIMNGEPYHYRLNADGTFLLYSVGWNQTDDGGKVAFQKDNPKAIDYEQGDWVCPTPKYSR